MAINMTASVTAVVNVFENHPDVLIMHGINDTVGFFYRQKIRYV